MNKSFLLLVLTWFAIAVHTHGSQMNVGLLASADYNIRQSEIERVSKLGDANPEILDDVLATARKGILDHEDLRQNRVVSACVEILGQTKYQPAIPFLAENLYFRRDFRPTLSLIPQSSVYVCASALSKMGRHGLHLIFHAFEQEETPKQMWIMLAALKDCDDLNTAKQYIESKISDETLAVRYLKLQANIPIFIRDKTQLNTATP